MRKALLYIIVCVVASCARVADTTTPPVDEGTRVGTLIDSMFQVMPNAINNEITRGVFADSIKAKFQTYRGTSLPYIADVPLAYGGCVKYPEGDLKNEGKYLVRFTYTDGQPPISEKCRTSFQVYAVLERDDVARLVDNAEYHLDGTFVDFANNSRETGFELPNGKCLVNYPSLNASTSNVFLNLGTIILDNLSFTQINNGNNHD